MCRRRCDERISERIRGRVPRILAAREQHRPRQPDSRRIVIDVAARVRINQFIRGGFEMRERDHRVRQRWGRLLRIPRPPARLRAEVNPSLKVLNFSQACLGFARL